MKNHFNVAVVIVRNNHDKKKFLFIQSKGVEGNDFWYFPNDIILSDQNSKDTAVKIVLKQTDIRCRTIPKEEVVCKDYLGTELHFVLAEQIYGRPCPLHDTIKDIRWCTKEEIRLLLDADLPYEVWQLMESE